jgi:capsular polysaccharide biosynthesis protein
VPCEIVFLDPELCYRVPNLLFVTPTSAHPIWKSPEALRMMSRTILARRPLPAGPARIFVPRRQAHGRALADQDAVERTLHAHGFVTIDPEGMSFDAQVAAFAAASVVIGGMGAAMCNTVFCAPGTRQIYLAPVGWMEPFYWDLAAACGHVYAACYGRATDADVEAYESGYEITPGQVGGILRFIAETE